MAHDHLERRGASRVKLKAVVNLEVNGSTIISDTDLKDISLDGIALLNANAPIPVNTICDFVITVTGASSVLTISGKGRIIRQDNLGTAIKFTELEMDSYLHLKNIIVLNRTPDER